MQLGLPFTFLLTTLVLALSIGVEAIPTGPRNGLLTLPLKRVHQARGDAHPLVLLQQHINRGLKRHARMTGRDAPSDHELRANIYKRVLTDDDPALLAKRYSRLGTQFRDKGNRLASSVKGKVNALAANDSANTGGGFSTASLNALIKGGLTAAVTPTAGNSLGLDIEANDVGYIATIQIGTPPRNFKLLMDSGSSDLWVGGDGCKSQDGGDCGNHVFLGSAFSSSFVDTGKQFQVTYGSGAVAGDIVTDNINIAGLKLNAHTFGVALVESVDFSSNATTFDGLMGLAQSTLSQQGTLTPVESLAKAGLIREAVTSYKISRLADGKNDGEISFGGLDPNKFDPATRVNFANVNTQGFWEGAMTPTVNGQDVGLQGRTAILDTGTTLIIAPPADAAAIHQAIPGAKSDNQGGFTIPCTTTAKVALTFSGQAFDIDPRDLLFAPVDPNNLQGDCVSGISSGNIGGNTEWLVGDVFLKNAYFSTDVTSNSISLAKLV